MFSCLILNDYRLTFLCLQQNYALQRLAFCIYLNTKLIYTIQFSLKECQIIQKLHKQEYNKL